MVAPEGVSRRHPAFPFSLPPILGNNRPLTSVHQGRCPHLDDHRLTMARTMTLRKTTLRNLLVLAVSGLLLSGCYVVHESPPPVYYGYYQTPRAYTYYSHPRAYGYYGHPRGHGHGHHGRHGHHHRHGW